ncbi:hypothetical protein D3C78_1649790 [compost metagenome]
MIDGTSAISQSWKRRSRINWLSWTRSTHASTSQSVRANGSITFKFCKPASRSSRMALSSSSNSFGSFR